MSLMQFSGWERSTSIFMFSFGVTKRIGELYMDSIGTMTALVKRMDPSFSLPVYTPVSLNSARWYLVSTSGAQWISICLFTN